jgi:histidyl-tRNA synthetase
LGVGRVQLKISNRKIWKGLCLAIGIEDITSILRIVDKKDKIGEKEVIEDLLKLGLQDKQAEIIVGLYSIKISHIQFSGLLRDFIARNDVIARSISDEAIHIMQEGITELESVLNNLSHLPEGAVVADLSIVRGLDYYTGTVYETQLLDVPEFTGSVCSGGRYDDLAGSYINKHLPGVGISIGFSRLFDVIRQKRPELLNIGPKGPAHVMVTVPEDEADRPLAYQAARILRARKINVEMYHAPKKMGDQLKYASKKMLPYVWFVRVGKHEVKDMMAQTQIETTPQTWEPMKT